MARRSRANTRIRAAANASPSSAAVFAGRRGATPRPHQGCCIRRVARLAGIPTKMFRTAYGRAFAVLVNKTGTVEQHHGLRWQAAGLRLWRRHHRRQRPLAVVDAPLPVRATPPTARYETPAAGCCGARSRAAPADWQSRSSRRRGRVPADWRGIRRSGACTATSFSLRLALAVNADPCVYGHHSTLLRKAPAARRRAVADPGTRWLA